MGTPIEFSSPSYRMGTNNDTLKYLFLCYLRVKVKYRFWKEKNPYLPSLSGE